MKLDFLLPSNVPGGAERVAINLLNQIVNKESFEIRLILFSQGNLELFYPINPKIDVLIIEGESKIEVIWSLFKLYKRTSPHCLICFLDIAIFYGLLLKLFFRIKLIISERNNPKRRKGNRFLDFFNPNLYFLADKIVLQTKKISYNYSPRFEKKKIVVIANPVLIPENKWNAEEFNNKQIIAIGRLEVQKGFDILLKAFHRVNLIFDSWSLVIIGTGSQKSELEKLTKKLKLEEKVVFLGVVKNIEQYLRKSSMYVLSSRFEGFPNTLLEAMAIGIPCIATNCDYGPVELIISGLNGMLCLPESEIDLANSIEKMISNPDLAFSYSKEAIHQAQKYSIGSISKQWIEVLNDIE
jgi:GalNAc-alpha-(1->4)-GalNAc-alpha-(1->3)-diNAcBac-PP-undecaprenol alpha-1,4-N-acetyl-D-galactosaminyltransferase